jgi:glycosyltransferase involved in cell wall biosynthesis
MRLLVVSHACATPINQIFFADVERISGWSITIVGPSTWNDDYSTQRTFERHSDFDGVIHPIPVWMNGHIPLHFYRSTFRSLLKNLRPDAIYVHHEPYAAATVQMYLANRLWHGCPIGFFTWQNMNKSYLPPFRQTERMVHQQSDFAFSGSESARNVLRSKGYRGPCALLPGSINPDIHLPDPSADGLRGELGIPDDAVVLGFMGRISRVKGLETLLEAVALLEDLPWHLVLVGDGDHMKPLQENATSRGLASRVHFTGYVPHTKAPRYLSFFDILVLPSETQPNWKEQFGRVLIESLACGTPVIGSDSGEIPHVITRSRGGLTFPEGKTDALARVLRIMIESPGLRTEHANLGRSFVLDEHTNLALARRFVDNVRQHALNAAPLTALS